MARIQERTRVDGKKYFRVQVRMKGYSSVSASFDRKSDATRWAEKVEYEMKENIYFNKTNSRTMAIEEIIDRYIAESLPTKNIKEKTKVERIQRLNWWKKEIGHKLLTDIKLSLFTKCKTELIKSKTKAQKPYSADTINYYLGDMSLVLTTASDEWELIKENPLLKVKKMKKPRGRVRFLTKEELKSLLTECKKSTNKHLYLIVLLALSTGARKSEILNLTVNQVDISKERIYLHETKNDERRMLPIKDPVLSLLQNHLDSLLPKQTLLFMGSKFGKAIDIRSSWKRALDNSKIEDFRFHDLRHTAASYLAMNGATHLEIATILGHKTLQMVMKYSHLSDSHIDGVVEGMNSKHFLDLD